MHAQYRRPLPPKPVVNPRWRAHADRADMIQNVRSEWAFPKKTRAEREREIRAEI